MKGHANYQDLFKTIAVIAMVIDHLGLLFFPEHTYLRVIGRIVMPIFCFFAGYNTTKPRPLIGQLGFILTLLVWISWQSLEYANMLVSIYFGQCYIYMMHKYSKLREKDFFLHVLLLTMLTPFTYPIMEYGTLSIAFMLVGNLYAKNKEASGFLPFLSVATMLFCLLFHFDIRDTILSSAAIALTGYCLSLKIQNNPIPIDLRVISRNSLAIYFFHYAILNIIRFSLIF